MENDTTKQTSATDTTDESMHAEALERGISDAMDKVVVEGQNDLGASIEYGETGSVGSGVKADPNPTQHQSRYPRIEDIPFNDPSYTIGVHRRRLVMLQTLMVDQYENITMELALLDNAISEKQ